MSRRRNPGAVAVSGASVASSRYGEDGRGADLGRRDEYAPTLPARPALLSSRPMDADMSRPMDADMVMCGRRGAGARAALHG